ncbi:MAG: hypothetical protein P8Y02_13705 [Deinococcales bacterium]
MTSRPVNSSATTSTGMSAGTVIRNSTLQKLAPSISACSKRSRGMESLPASTMMVASGSMRQTLTMMIEVSARSVLPR